MNTPEKVTSVNTWADLEHFGINALTREACAYNLRILCDLNAEGAAAVVEYLGLNSPSELCAPWNTTVDGKPSTASILLPHEILMPLAAFLMFQDGALACAMFDDATVGIYDEERLAMYSRGGRHVRRNPARGSAAPTEGSRHVHAMSGRAR